VASLRLPRDSRQAIPQSDLSGTAILKLADIHSQDPSPPSDELPRLLYIGDVPVTNTFAGAALLYRLLAFYPPGKLMVICSVTPAMRTLPGVEYHHWGAAFPRLLQTRFSDIYCLWHFWRHGQIPRVITRVADAFQPQAVLSVSHASAWRSAWHLSAARSIPFHLIAHDDYAFSQGLPKIVREWAERKFAEAYRGANSRFCISREMAELYCKRYGKCAEVIYPTWDLATSSHQQLASRTSQAKTSLTFAYAGSIHEDSVFKQIILFATIATQLGHRVLVYTPQYNELAARASSTSVVVKTCAPLPPEELFLRLRQEADCLMVVQSHDAELPQIATLFPTKFADYSVLGLPIIVWAPAHSALVQFVAEYADCVELVTDANCEGIERGIMRLAGSPERRVQLAKNAMEMGKNYFSPVIAWTALKAALLRSSPKTYERRTVA
jgi:hypothetical protein